MRGEKKEEQKVNVKTLSIEPARQNIQARSQLLVLDNLKFIL